MSQPLKILLPTDLWKSQTNYFRGIVDITEKGAITVYITKYSTSKNEVLENNNKLNCIYGYLGHTKILDKFERYPNYLLLHRTYPPEINKIRINGTNLDVTNNFIVMLYDYNTIRNSEIIYEYDEFTKLQNLIHTEYGIIKSKKPKTSFIKTPYWLASSMFLQHLINYMNMMKWLMTTIKSNKKLSIKQGNLISAIIIDIILGYITLQLLSHDTKDISLSLLGVLEKLINSLYSLLKWLMGAPVGLKLNNAFNKMLGKYFSYHIQLWWLFLDVSGEKLDIILHVYRYVGYLGFTFQTAVISDLICIATFHSYCIYVYAARLFNMQISGLIALLRLFVGRKYNPLRGGIDSCEYTNQELFVGTVAFTILLLLLPTTALYYIVFTLFRILSLIVQYILAKLIHLVQTLPLYVITLWMVQSPKIAGNMLVEVVSSTNNKSSPLCLKVKLHSKPIQKLVNASKPPVVLPKCVEWTNLVSNVLVGKQIV